MVYVKNEGITGGVSHGEKLKMGQVTKVGLSCYLVLLSFGSKTR